ncbi:unnamed protein product, partial [Prunus brigantina]
VACTRAAYLCDRSLSLGNPISSMSPNQNLGVSPLPTPRCNSHRTSPIPESPSTQDHHMLSICLLKCHTHVGYAMAVLHFLILILATIWAFETMVMFTKFHWFGTIQVVRVQDYDCVHTVFTLPLGNCVLDFDLGYLLGIRDQGGGFEVDNGHTGKEENFCKVYGYELESLRALLLSPRAHSKGLGAIDVLVSFPIIGEFYVTSGMQKMAAVGECSAKGNCSVSWVAITISKIVLLNLKGYAHLDFSCILGKILTFF